jgi:hypothetical protein
VSPVVRRYRKSAESVAVFACAAASDLPEWADLPESGDEQAGGAGGDDDDAGADDIPEEYSAEQLDAEIRAAEARTSRKQGLVNPAGE